MIEASRPAITLASARRVSRTGSPLLTSGVTGEHEDNGRVELWLTQFQSPLPVFEDLTPEEQVKYVQDLWDYVVADASKVPVPDWHRRILDERLAEYHAAPHEGKPWSQVRDQLLRELAERKRGRN